MSQQSVVKTASISERTIDLSKIEIGDTSSEENRVFYLVEIVGKSPLLMHNPVGSMVAEKGKRGETKIPLPEVEAAKARYLSDDGKELVIPSRCVHRATVTASGAYKSGKQSMAPFIAGSIQFYPNNLLLGRAADDYEIDLRRAVIQKAGVMRARPVLRQWGTFAVITWNTDDVPSTFSSDMLKNMMTDAGNRLGVGDFRPEKKGSFGRFVVKSVNEIDTLGWLVR